MCVFVCVSASYRFPYIILLDPVTLVCIGTDSGVRKQPTPQKQHSNQLAHLLNLQRRSEELKSKAAILLASQLKGGAIRTPVSSFVSPNFSQVCMQECLPDTDIVWHCRPDSRSAIFGD